VALTFDAEHPDRPLCPSGNTERILDILEAAGVRASFFVQSRWATAHPALARRIADDGHVVGHHSKFHVRMPLLSDDGLRADIQEGEQEIMAATGVDPRPLFRCPFGAGREDPRVLDALRARGYREVHHHVMAEDWEPWRTPDEVTAAVLDGVRDRDGADTVVLLHAWPAPTAAALPRILERLIPAGVQFVGVDQLTREGTAP
jgi:peptidoglycan/xylan/chitin deacetylase (PgdA/CDA1 family)